MAIIIDGYISSGVIAGDNYSETTYIYSGTSTTFIVPDNVASMTFEAWGGGCAGEGGSAPASTQISYGGGGGGAYARTTILNPANGASFSLTVGAGGNPVSGAPGTSGGTTTISSGVTIYCKAAGGGGYAGINIGGRIEESFGDVEYAGGNGGPGCSSDCGLPGGQGGGGAGSTGAGAGGAGTSEFGGNGGAGGAATGPGDTFNNGFAGNNYGAGGGGGNSFNSTNCSGGSGAKGLIRITYQTLL